MPHKYHNYLHLLAVAVALCFPLVAPARAATSISLTWNGSSDPEVTGYNVFYGTNSGNYTASLNVGNSTTATLPALTSGATYFAVVTAYNAANLQSLPSNEISFTVPENIPPAVALTSPQSGASFNSSTPISLSATASDPDGSITKVEFYADTTLVGQDMNSPYAATWNSPSSGNHLLTAVAYDDSGTAVRSSGVAISVLGSTTGPTPTPATASNRRMNVLAPRNRVKAGGRARFKIVASSPDRSQTTVVNYTVGGTATSGVDFMQGDLSGQAVIPAGARSANLIVNTLRVPGATTRQSLMITLLPGSGYTLGQQTANVTIVGR